MIFSRQTLLEACHVFPELLTHSEMDTLMLELELDHLLSRENKEYRANGIFQYLVKIPAAQINGQPLERLVVESAVKLALSSDYHREQGTFGALFRALDRDGFVVRDGQLRPGQYANYSFEQWLVYMESQMLVTRKDDKVYITLDGREFLKYLIHQGYTLYKYG